VFLITEEGKAMSTTGKIFIVIFAAIVIALGSVVESSAEIRVRRLKINPEIGVQETYRSNIYQTENNRKSDFVTTVIPGIDLEYNFGSKHSFTAGYKGAWNNYAKYSNNNYWDHEAFANLSLRFPGGLDLGVEQKYINNWLERSANIDRQRHYIENITGVSGAYRFGDRWKAEARYNRDDYSFSSDRDRQSSYVADLYGGAVYYRFLPRTAALVEYQHIVKDYDVGRIHDSTTDIVYLGVQFDPAGKLRGDIKAGYGWKDYDESLPGRSNTANTWMVASKVSYDMSKYTNFELRAIREFQDDGDFGNVPYYRTFASLTAQHFFTYKIGASATVAYQQNDYTNDAPDPLTGRLGKRQDDRWTFGAGAFYNIQKYLKTRLDYEYITRDSNFNTYSFDEHRIMFKVVLSVP